MITQKELEEARKKVEQGIQIDNLKLLLALEVVEHLRTMDTTGEGVEFENLVKRMETANIADESVIDDILFELSYEGMVYQTRPECYKLMDD